MTIEAKKRLANAGYGASKRCSNCAYFKFIEKTQIPHCAKHAAPVSKDRVCTFYKSKGGAS
jgi:hypothetical protein